MVRRRKKDVLTQLPAKHRRTVVVKVSDADATKLRELRHNLEVADRDSSGEQSWDSMMALGEMWRAAGLAKLNVRAVSVLNFRSCFSVLIILCLPMPGAERLHARLVRSE